MPRIMADLDKLPVMANNLDRAFNDMVALRNDLLRANRKLDMKVASRKDLEARVQSCFLELGKSQVFLANAAAHVRNANRVYEEKNKNLMSAVEKLNFQMGRFACAANVIVPGQSVVSPQAVYDAMNLNRTFGISWDSQKTIYASMRAIRSFRHNMEQYEAAHSVQGQSILIFMQHHDPFTLFQGYDDVNTFINDLNFVEEFGYSCVHYKQVILAFLYGSDMNDVALEFLNDKSKCKEFLRDLVDDMCETNYEFSLPEQNAMLTGLAKDYCSYMGLKDDAEVLDHIGFLVGSDKQIGKLLANYQKNVELLESVLRTCPEDSQLYKVTEQLLFDYKQKNLACLRDTFVHLTDLNDEGMIKLAIKGLTDGNFGKIDLALKYLGKTDTMSGMDTVLFASGMRADAVASFQAAAEKIQSGSFTQEDMTTYENSFELAKELTIKQYEGMIKYYGGKKDFDRVSELEDKLETLKELKCTDFSAAAAPPLFFEHANDLLGGGVSPNDFSAPTPEETIPHTVDDAAQAIVDSFDNGGSGNSVLMM